MSDDAALAEAPDPAVVEAEWRLQMLKKAAEMEMALAEAFHRQAMAAANPAPPTPPAAQDAAAASGAGPDRVGELSAGFTRATRSLRLTLALHGRTSEQLRALRAGEAAKVEARRVADRKREADEAEAQSRKHRTTIERLVIEAAEREAEDDDSLGAVMEALEERLNEDEAYEDLDLMPVREAVERLCVDLELNPDWSLWEGEGWPPKPPFSRSKFSMWASPSRTPLLGPIDPALLRMVGMSVPPRLE
jgi:hypothetical protein